MGRLKDTIHKIAEEHGLPEKVANAFHGGIVMSTMVENASEVAKLPSGSLLIDRLGFSAVTDDGALAVLGSETCVSFNALVFPAIVLHWGDE